MKNIIGINMKNREGGRISLGDSQKSRSGRMLQFGGGNS
jgi:hypothetical protein